MDGMVNQFQIGLNSACTGYTLPGVSDHDQQV